MTKNIANSVPLTQDEAIKIGGAYQRIVELQARAIKSATEDAELTGLLEFLAGALMGHANEFIGCWFAVRNEYEPVIGLLARVSQRVAGINQQQAIAAHLAQQQAAAQAGPKVVEQPGNIVTLDAKA